MIGNYIQPKEIPVDETLSLVKYYRNYKRTLPWYQDVTVCKQVDNVDSVYDVEKLSRMYRYLSQKGECYYLKFFENGRYHLVGDISLCNEEISIVICKEYQNRHLGRKAVTTLLSRAKEIGLPQVNATIYSFNAQSKKMFLAVGFKQIDEENFTFSF